MGFYDDRPEQGLFPYYSPELERGIQTPEAAVLAEAHYVLNSPLVEEMVERGEVTLCMIRPHVHEAVMQEGLSDEEQMAGWGDQQAADVLEGRITDLGIVAKFSIQLDTQAVQEFYGGAPQESMSKERPVEHASGMYASRWEEFVDFMSSGSVTVLLLRSGDMSAIESLRNQLGHWNIEKTRDPATIRGQLAKGNANNLIHGSDSPESVIRELAILKGCLLRLTGHYYSA